MSQKRIHRYGYYTKHLMEARYQKVEYILSCSAPTVTTGKWSQNCHFIRSSVQGPQAEAGQLQENVKVPEGGVQRQRRGQQSARSYRQSADAKFVLGAVPRLGPQLESDRQNEANFVFA
jgi:hypothetical protein